MFSLQILQEMSMLSMMVMSYHTYVVVCSKCCTVFVFFVKKKIGSRKMAGRGGQETCDKKTDWWLQEGKKGKGKELTRLPKPRRMDE